MISFILPQIFIIVTLSCFSRDSFSSNLGDENSNIICSGFSWAENLAFDGIGGMFISDAVTGKLWRAYQLPDHLNYDCSVHINYQEEISSFGGLAVTPDGQTLYAGVSFKDGSHGFISTSTSKNADSAVTGKMMIGNYTIVAKTTEKPNGFAADWQFKRFFYTYEGGKTRMGTVSSLDLASGIESIVYGGINADGAWIDTDSQRLFIGTLATMKIAVFDISQASNPVFLGLFTGAASESKPHMLDDLTVFGAISTSKLAETIILGADWTGRAVVKFSLNGSLIETLPAPDGITLQEPTSVRWGMGPGFDSNSIYVSEGGGATDLETGRRIIRYPLL